MARERHADKDMAKFYPIYPAHLWSLESLGEFGINRDQNLLMSWRSAFKGHILMASLENRIKHKILIVITDGI